MHAAFEPFVVTLSSLASARGEEIAFDGELSEQLSVGLNEYWRILSRWDPAKFNPITVKATSLSSSAPAKEGVAAAAFSGGVDSFFTQYLNFDRPPGFRTKYAVFIHGFDIPLSEAKIFDDAASAYEAALRKEGVELVRVTTNARAFIPPGFWEMGHGSGLIGTALALSSGINRFFVPSSKSYGTLEPWGSDPLTDGLLSTERVHVIHDGAYYSRFDKINLMKDWDTFRKLVRTCYVKPAAFENCGKCQNCRRTMMVLASLGVLDRFETFPKVSSPFHFVTCNWETPHEKLFGSQAIAHSMKNGRFGLAGAGIVAMRTSPIAKLLKKQKKISRRIRGAFQGESRVLTN
ncbi:hypothetical protein [Hyphomicrobium sp.]|uniref:hypothetical protein n=1 Tax=Hyphomicrobium sp. TaxID=82 RepID=UPI002D798185|nr:hypothetical protein [Hyphomicrobium sp.]HET6387962.1 hypothetical protein [Hyphomicrobium sp.]